MAHSHRAVATGLIAAFLGAWFTRPGPTVRAADAPPTTAPAAQSTSADPLSADLNSLYGKDAQQGVYVRDSAVAVGKLALAERMERLKEWGKSADVYQEILEKYPDRVVPSKVDSQGRIYQYISVALAVQQHLGRWPAEGLAVYNARFGAIAGAQLQQASDSGNDFAALHRILATYFVTDAGKEAGLRLVSRYFEAGEFPSAAWVGHELLQWHPALAADDAAAADQRAALLYRVGLACHLSGEPAQARAALDELKDHYPNAKGTVAGKQQVLATSLAQALTDLPTAPVAQASSAPAGGAGGDSWPMFMGSADRARVLAAGGRPGAPIFSVALSAPPQRNSSDPRLRQFEMIEAQQRSRGATLGVMPATDRGELFFQDGARVYAVGLESGLPLPGWAQTYGGQRHGQFVTNGTPMPAGRLSTVSLTDQSVLALMNQSDPGPYRFFEMQRPPGQGDADSHEARLVCLNRANGSVRWVFTPRQLPDESQRQLRLGGSPLVVGDNVYLTASSGQEQLQDCQVICLDLNTGATRWVSQVVSANAAVPWDDGLMLSSEPVGQLAYAGGRLYVLSNLGAIAAVDAYSGAVAWLDIYPRNIVVQTRRPANLAARSITKPWTLNPPIIQDGKLFVMPSDCDYLMVYDGADGTELHRINLPDLRRTLSGNRGIGGEPVPDTLIGVTGPRLLIGSDKIVACLKWQDYRSDRPLADNVFWISSRFEAAPVMGRSFLTTDAVYVPTAARLVRIGLRSGMIEQTYPSDLHTWQDGEGPGNVLVTGEQVIIAGAKSLNAYTDMTLARARLERDAQAAPTDPQPRLRYAEVMFAAGQQDLAIQKLDEAIDLLGGRDAMRPGGNSNGGGEVTTAARDRVFNDALTFAQRMAQAAAPSSAAVVKQVNGLFDRAAAAASVPAQTVNYLLTRARFDYAQRDFISEVDHFQQILSDPRLRVVMVPDDSQRGPVAVAASTLAEQKIAQRVSNLGPAVYARFEQQAAAALSHARAPGATPDPDALIEIARQYPNSTAAPQAMLAAADAYEQTAQPRQATDVLHQLYFQYPALSDRDRVLEALARNYLAMPNHLEVALARLEQAAKLSGTAELAKPLTLPDGRVLDHMPRSAALQQLRDYAQRAAASQRPLPDLHLPVIHAANAPATRPAPFVASGPQDVLQEVTALVAQDPATSRTDRIITWSNTLGLRVLAPGQSQPVITCSDLGEAPTAAWWIGANLLLAGPRQLAVLNGQNGQILWRRSVTELPTVDLTGAIASGAARASGSGAGGPGAAVAGNDDDAPVDDVDQIVDIDNRWIAQQAVIGGRPMVLLPNGQWVPAGPSARHGRSDIGGEQILDVVVTTGRIVLSTSTGRLVALRPDNGQIAWQVRLVEDRAPDRLVAGEDFTAAAWSDGRRAQLCVLHTATGTMARRWSLGNSGPVSNLAMAPQGVLVYTLPNRIRGKDLYELAGPNDAPYTWEARGLAASALMFAEMTDPDQLLIADGRVLALSDRGRFLRVYRLNNNQPGGADADRPGARGRAGGGMGDSYGTGFLDIPARRNANAPGEIRLPHLLADGPMVYIIGPRSLQAYNLDKPQQRWTGSLDLPRTNLLDAMLTRDFVLAVNDPMRRAAEAGADHPEWNVNSPVSPVELLAYSRQMTANGESGRRDYDPAISSPSGIVAWQVADGGFYYLTADHTLHVLNGSSP